MNILLINPPEAARRSENVWRNIASVMPPLGIAWLAAALEREGHEVRILDANALRLSTHEVPAWIRGHGRFDMAGITATTPLIANALEIARLVKTEWPETRLVLGGVHPTVLPEEVLSEPAADVVVRGEGEITLGELAAEKPWEQIDGLSYRRDGQVVHNPDRQLIGNLDTLPMPAYHLLPMDKYRPAAGAAKRTPATSMLATRGCPGRCTFCYRLFGARLRCRSGRIVAEEVKLLQDRYQIKEICFYDDTFTAVKPQVKSFCQAVRDLGIDLTWSCFSRIDTFDLETFRMMKECGCHQVMFGVETCNPQILRNINKRIRLDRVEDVVRDTQRLGIEVRVTFMLGNPGETVATMEETIRYAIRLNPDLALFNITTPFPGTEMHQWADENGYLLSRDWKDYDLSTPVMRLPTVSPEAILKAYRSAHLRFYLRPRCIGRQLTKLRSREAWSSSMRGLRMLLSATSLSWLRREKLPRTAPEVAVCEDAPTVPLKKAA